MIDQKIEGFLIKKTIYQDNDAILNILTKDGVETFKARGILKSTSKNANACNFCVLGEYNLSFKKEGSNKTLKSASIIKMYHIAYDDMLIMSSFLFISNLAYLVSESINCYDLCIDCFTKLEKREKPINVLVYFLKNICNELGYRPNLQGCINCNKKNNLISFSLNEGGFICSDCFIQAQHEKFSKDYLKDVYDLYKNDKYLEINDVRAVKMFTSYVTFLKEEVGIVINNDKLIYQSL